MKKVIRSLPEGVVTPMDSKSSKIYALCIGNKTYLAHYLGDEAFRSKTWAFLRVDKAEGWAFEPQQTLSALLFRAVDEKGAEIFEFDFFTEFAQWLDRRARDTDIPF